MLGFADTESFKELIITFPSIAIRQLYDHYYKVLVHMAERRTNNQKAAEDIVQDAFAEVWKKFEWLARRKDILIGPYLISVVKKKAITHFHQSHRFHETSSDVVLEALQSTRTSKEAELIQADRHRMLHDIVSTLPRRERECIQMRFLSEMSIDSISTQLGISRKSVEKGITKGLKRLRKRKQLIY